MWCFVSFFGSEGEIVFGVKYVLSVQYSCAVVSFLLLWRERFITTGEKKSSSCLSVWRVVLLCQFLVLAGNRFWLYILLCIYVGRGFRQNVLAEYEWIHSGYIYK